MIQSVYAQQYVRLPNGKRSLVLGAHLEKRRVLVHTHGQNGKTWVSMKDVTDATKFGSKKPLIYDSVLKENDRT